MELHWMLVLAFGLSTIPWTECDGDSPPQMSPIECGALYLSVSSLRAIDKFRLQRLRKAYSSPNVDDRIEMNWNFAACKDEDVKPDTIALFTADPEFNNATLLEVITPSEFKWNYHVTSVSLKPGSLPGGWGRKNLYRNAVGNRGESGVFCLPYWIASYKNGKLMKKNCMKIYPTWIEDAKEFIGDIPLSSLIIPGTHNAGSYAFNLKVEKDAVLDKFTLCQDRDLWTQLVSGIRYLDFRVGYYEKSKSLFSRNRDNPHKLWLNHNFIQVTPLLPLLEDVRKFLDSTSSEIVILDIHQLPVGFYQGNELIMDRHQHLMDVLKNVFGNHINSFTETVFWTYSPAGPTVDDILKSGRRLIIGYPERKILNQNKWLWPAVRHMWGNTNDPYVLKEYLDNVMENPPTPNFPISTPLWSAMAQTTPTVADVLIGKNSLRKQAEAINRNLTSWVSNSWWSKANIVASDFYTGNNVIDIAVYFNYIKGQLAKTNVGKLFFNRVNS